VFALHTGERIVLPEGEPFVLREPALGPQRFAAHR
jgi:hypothetical protein